MRTCLSALNERRPLRIKRYIPLWLFASVADDVDPQCVSDSVIAITHTIWW